MLNEGTFWVDEEKGHLIFKNEGREDRFVIDDELILNETKYLILVPADLVDEDDEKAIIMRVDSKGKEEILTVIEDDDEFMMVKEAYLNE